jgi:hypothetical protein
MPDRSSSVTGSSSGVEVRVSTRHGLSASKMMAPAA